MIRIRLMSAAIGIAALMAVSGSVQVSAQETAKGGGQKLMQAKPLTSQKEMSAARTGDLALSTCPKCKMTHYKRVETAKGGAAQLQTGKAQSCPACDGKVSDNGTAKHTCKMCGGEMICCVIPAETAAGQKEK